MKPELWALCLVLLSPTLMGCVQPSYSAKSITTRVIDADTKQPIEGVIAVAYWRLEAGSEGGTAGELMLLETVTDSSGMFRFPAWGPRRAPIGRLFNEDPTILLFRHGYQPRAVVNTFRGVDMPAGVRSFYYDGKDIEMHKFQGNLKEWAMHLMDFSGDIDTATVGHCEWKEIPRLIIALGKERENLNAAGIGVGNYYDRLVGSDARQISEGCGSVREFLQEQAP